MENKISMPTFRIFVTARQEREEDVAYWSYRAVRGKQIRWGNGNAGLTSGSHVYGANLLGCIDALESLEKPSKVRMLLRDETVVKAMTLWMPNWKANGWKKPDKTSISHLKRFQRLDELCQIHKVVWKIDEVGRKQKRLESI